MPDLIIVLVCIVLVLIAWRLLAGKAERQVLGEMSDAVINTYAIFDEDGTPLNSYAEEYDRRRKVIKEKSCRT